MKSLLFKKISNKVQILLSVYENNFVEAIAIQTLNVQQDGIK